MYLRNRHKTADYKNYQLEILDELKGIEWPFGTSQLNVLVYAGLSNRGADIDNVIKPILDTYQSIYDEFNDNKVYSISLFKDIVPKGDEYLHITFTERTDIED